MAKNAIYTVKYRRKREGKTHYKNRLELLKSDAPRLVVRRSNTSLVLQIVQYQHDGDKVLCAFNAKKLESYGWKYSKKSLPASYLAGLALGRLAIAAGVKEAIFDLGLQTPIAGSKVYAALKGVVDAGVQVPCSDDIFPTEERITGQHIAGAADVKGNFSAYRKEKLDVQKLPDVFASVKERIMA